MLLNPSAVAGYSLSHLLEQHLNMDVVRRSTIASLHANKDDTVNIWVQFTQVMISVSQENQLEVFASLYSGSKCLQRSREYLLRLTPNGFPLAGLDHRMLFMFTGLTATDLDADPRIVLRFFRKGAMALTKTRSFLGSRKSTPDTETKAGGFRRPVGCCVIPLQKVFRAHPLNLLDRSPDALVHTTAL